MGNIHDSVITIFSTLDQTEQSILKAFTHSFTISWIRRFDNFGTTILAALAKPDKHFADGTNYSEEILCVYSPFNSIEPRALRLTERITHDPEIAHRVDAFAIFFISDASNIHEKINEIGIDLFRTQILVPINSTELIQNRDDSWFIRQRFLERVCGRDLFDIRLPIEDDLNFFGRKDLINSITDSVKKGQNIGIFGLRKTGKTSILLRTKRTCEVQQLGIAVYIDCKSPEVWQLNWLDLLVKIAAEISPGFWPDEKTKGQGRVSILREAIVKSNRRVVIIFDEIEFISPTAKLAPHWKNEFTPFWQLLWSIQSATKNLSVVIAGVDPSVAENPTINKIQNPLFSIFKISYVSGLREEDLRSMVRLLGRKIGLSIDYTPSMWLFSRYGGHPLLTRLACSVIHKIVSDKKEIRPFEVTESFLNLNADVIDAEVLFYAEHVMISLRDAFPSEANLLEMLGVGRNADFFDQAKNTNSVRHLISYGLIKKDISGQYSISIIILQEYLQQQQALSEKNGTKLWIVPKKQRTIWLSGRLYRVLKDFRHLDKLLKSKSCDLFGPVTLPESEIFQACKPAHLAPELAYFINAANKTFVESIEAYGDSIKSKNHFWTTIKDKTPNLYDALFRIKVYRNNDFHLLLTQKTLGDLSIYLRRDLGPPPYTSLDDIFFILQQRTLDSLLYGLQIEIAKLES